MGAAILILMSLGLYIYSKYDKCLYEAETENFREIIDNLSISDFDFVKTLDQQSVSAIYLLGQSRIVDIVKQ